MKKVIILWVLSGFLIISNICFAAKVIESQAKVVASAFPVPVIVVIDADQNPVCEGTTVTISAMPTNGGTAPEYQWKKNGSNVGSNSNTYTYVPSNGDVITCILTSNQTCITNNTAHSNAVAMVVNDPLVVDAGTDQSINFGLSTTLYGSAVNGSGNYTWHWEPASLLLDPDIQNPVTLNLSFSVLFTLTVTDVVTGFEGSDNVIVGITGGPLAVITVANPDEIYQGFDSQLNAIVSGGSGTFTYAWSSIPPGFSSSLQNPAVYPIVTTTYTLEVNDEFNTVSNNVSVTVIPPPPPPDVPNGPDRIDLVYTTETFYNILPVEYASTYLWEIEPSSAGSIAGNTTIAKVIWNPDYKGIVVIRVKALNASGESLWSVDKVTSIDNTIGISSHDPAKNIVLYPNPNQGIFYIRSTEALLSVIILEPSGKQIAEIKNPGENYKYNYGNLPPGVYFVRIMGEKLNTVRKIIISVR